MSGVRVSCLHIFRKWVESDLTLLAASNFFSTRPIITRQLALGGVLENQLKTSRC